MAISAATLLGLLMFAFAVSGISGLADDLEAATPQRVPAPATEQLHYESRQIDCPLPERERPRI